ncbi:MAG TPA: hypothetical protein VMV71_01110 [Candidatus Paceibacterota bacterium]|nr:hypothetical protein [Candidatus Paceibacterota bacterium]
MPKPSGKIFISIIVLAVVAGSAIFYFRKKPEIKQIACSQEAKLCPDGSYVGRTGPDCEFKACPPVPAASSTDGGAGILPYNSGVRGTVLLGPACPVERIPPDPGCADKSYSVNISVFHAGASALYASGKSDENGIFQFSLPPGSYTLKAESGSMFPRCGSADVTVGPIGYATTTIFCDTGIR